MARNSYKRWKRLPVAVVGTAAILLTVPASAWAGSAHHGGGRHGNYADAGRHYSGFGGGHYRQHRGHHYRQHRSHHYRQHRGHGYRNAKHHYQTRYFCRPCNRYFDARHGLHDHVVQLHHVPIWQLANAITYSTLGWIFHG